jgi:hypothetical protein
MLNALGIDAPQAALISKEYRQLARDRLTFAMIVGIPAIQLIVSATRSTSMRGTCPPALLIRPNPPLTRARHGHRTFTSARSNIRSAHRRNSKRCCGAAIPIGVLFADFDGAAWTPRVPLRNC